MTTSMERGEEAGAAEGNGSFIERLAAQMGMHARAASVYGDPVERGGVTVIPVARVRWGFGGGAGRGPEEKGSGMGAGGGAMATPAGYIEIHEGVATYHPIHDLMQTLGGVALIIGASGVTTWLLLRGIRGLWRD